MLVSVYIYSRLHTVHDMLIFTFTAVHVQYMLISIYIYSSSQGAGRIASIVIGVIFPVMFVGCCGYSCLKKRNSFQGKTPTSMYFKIYISPPPPFWYILLQNLCNTVVLPL